MKNIFNKLILTALCGALAYNTNAQQQVSASLSTPRTDVFLNETISLTLSVRALNLTLGQAMTLQNMPPENTLKRISDFETMPVKRESHDNNTVETHEFRIAFRPLSTGVVHIAPRLQFTVVTRQRSIWGSSTVQQQAVVDVQPLILRVSDLPKAGRPADFQNAVGKFSFDVKLDPSDVSVGDLVTLLMTIRGTGYLDDVQAPGLGAMKDFKIYDPEIAVESESIKTFRQILIPSNTNATEIGEISFSFFDPDAGSYKIIKQGPFPLTFHPEKSTVLEHFRPEESAAQKTDITALTGSGVDTTAAMHLAEKRKKLPHEQYATTTQEGTAMLAPALSSVPSFKVPVGASVKIVRTHGDWVMVEYGNNRGWLHVSALNIR